MTSDASHYVLNISIINYCTPELTMGCVDSIVASNADFSWHITIVDNASSDDSVSKLRAYLAGQKTKVPITLVESPVNGGFSAGHNVGTSTVSAQFHILLNSDTYVMQGALDHLVSAAKGNPEAGLIVPCLVGDNGEAQQSQFRFPSALRELDRAAATGLVTRVLPGADSDVSVASGFTRADWVSFACVLIKDEVLQQVGPMDEGFFLYYEDADYCRDVTSLGWKIFLEAEARVVHYRGGSAPVKSLSKAKKRLPCYWYESRTRFFYKTYGRTGLLLANLAWVLGRCIANARILLGRRPPPSHDREWRDIWRNFF